MFKCISCATPLVSENLYEYCQCPKCRSFNFVSDKSAAEENRIYFNQHFLTLEAFKESNDKNRICADFLELDSAKRNGAQNQFWEAQLFVNSLLDAPGSVLEVGFGRGERLIKWLEKGVDAYGIDISEVALDGFAQKNPQFQDRVFHNQQFNLQVDLVYCCALFEHLDTPVELLEAASKYLKKGGMLILDAIPIVNEENPQLSVDEDINFWKPCHRVIYSINGLKKLLQKYGFNVSGFGMADNYNYRVLSMHIKNGFLKVVDLRNACLDHPELPNLERFYKICQSALDISSLALYGIAIFEKA